ncbi:MAG TPA: hypothetical protein VIB47_00470 [Dehalococcoidia bacterium]
MVTRPGDRGLPPIAELAIAAMALVIIGGTYIAAHIPREVPLLLPTILAVLAGALLMVNLLLLRGIKEFAWATFRLVFGWSLAGYGVIAALLTYVFVRSDIPGDVMAFLAAMLVIYALDIPLLLAFSVARYQPVGSSQEP